MLQISLPATFIDCVILYKSLFGPMRGRIITISQILKIMIFCIEKVGSNGYEKSLFQNFTILHKELRASKGE